MALLSSAETPIWMFLVASVLVPLSVGFGGKFLDMWWQARTAKKAEKKRKDGKWRVIIRCFRVLCIEFDLLRFRSFDTRLLDIVPTLKKVL